MTTFYGTSFRERALQNYYYYCYYYYYYYYYYYSIAYRSQNNLQIIAEFTQLLDVNSS